MAFFRARIATRWVSANGRNDCELALNYRDDIREITDVTNQPDEAIPPDINVYTVEAAFLTPDQLTAIEADPNAEVLWSEPMAPEEESARPFWVEEMALGRMNRSALPPNPTPQQEVAEMLNQLPTLQAQINADLGKSPSKSRDRAQNPSAQEINALRTFLRDNGMSASEANAIARAERRDIIDEDLRGHQKIRPKQNSGQAGGQAEVRER